MDPFDPTSHPNLHAMGMMAGQFFAGNQGNVAAQFMPQQGFYDQLRAQQQQRDAMAAMQGAAQAEAKQYGKFLYGVGTLTELPMLKDPKYLNTLTNDGANILPFVGMFANNPSARPWLRAMGGPQGSAMMAALDIQRANEYMPDPATGGTYSGTSAGQLVTQVAANLYGPGSDNAMRGVAIDEASQFLLASRQRGQGPRSIRSIISDKDLAGIERMRASGGPFDVRNVLSKDTQAQLEPAEMSALQSSGGEHMDDMLRNVDAMRTSGFFKKSAELLRAFKDVFGPNSDINQATQVMRALTQNNAQGLDNAQLAQSLQLTKELGTRSGLGMEGMMQLTGHLGNFASANGLDRRGVSQAVQGAAAYRSAFMANSLGEIPGLDIDKLSTQHAQLQMQAGNSPVAAQMGATLNIANAMGGFTAGSEAERLTAALKAGKTTYDGGKSVYLGEEQWRKVMEAGGADAGVLRDMRMNKEYNTKTAIDSGLDSTVRTMQRERTLRPTFSKDIADMFGRSSALKGVNEGQISAMATAAFDSIMGMDIHTYGTDKDAAQTAVMAALRKTPGGAGLSEQQLKSMAGFAMASFEGSSARRGWGGGKDVKALFDPKQLAAAREAHTRSALMADFAGQISGVGGDDVLTRVVDAIMSADEKTTSADIGKKILNVVSSKEINDAIAPHAKRIEDEKNKFASLIKGPGMVGDDGKLTEAGLEARQKHIDAIKGFVKDMHDDVKDAASASDGKPTPGKPAPGDKVSKDMASGGPERLVLSGTLDIGGDRFPISGEATKNPFTPLV